MNEELPQSIEEMSDILDVEGISTWPWLDHAGWIIAGVVILISLLLSWYFWHRFRKRKKKNVQLIPRQRAKQDLKNLKKQSFPEQNNYSLYYLQLTEILRRFINDEFQVEALERTTQEILFSQKEFQSHFDSESQWQNFVTLLKRSDEAKFATATLTPEIAKSDFEFVKSFVEQKRV